MKSKDRAFLRKEANSIETILFIGKQGVTSNITDEVNQMLKARELIKGKVLDNALSSSRAVANEISDTVNCHVIQVIGSKFVLYKKNKDICKYKID
ncbi:MAG: YhbY family RNA-binding protein [Oscillospiraceae bacterium]